MDPTEVKRINDEAEYQITGEVIADAFYQDISNVDNHPVQIRKMSLKIGEIIKSTGNIKNGESVDVYYTYIPTWDIGQYVGGSKRMDIAIGDVITVWLEEGNEGFEPVLSGDSVIHEIYVADRTEHIPEPFWQSFIRSINSVLHKNMDIIVLSGLILVLAVALFQGLKGSNKQKEI